MAPSGRPRGGKPSCPRQSAAIPFAIVVPTGRRRRPARAGTSWNASCSRPTTSRCRNSSRAAGAPCCVRNSNQMRSTRPSRRARRAAGSATRIKRNRRRNPNRARAFKRVRDGTHGTIKFSGSVRALELWIWVTSSRGRAAPCPRRASFAFACRGQEFPGLARARRVGLVVGTAVETILRTPTPLLVVIVSV